MGLVFKFKRRVGYIDSWGVYCFFFGFLGVKLFLGMVFICGFWGLINDWVRRYIGLQVGIILLEFFLFGGIKYVLIRLDQNYIIFGYIYYKMYGVKVDIICFF